MLKRKRLVSVLMKYLLCIFLCSLLSCSSRDPETTVYITSTGSKYHRDPCIYVEESRIPISLSEASQRYTPCEKCNPPVYDAAPVITDTASVTTSESSTTIQTKSVQCSAYTQKGKRCKRMTHNAHGKCFQHDH